MRRVCRPCARAPPANTMFTGRGTRGGTRGGRDQFNWEDVRGMDADRTHYLGASVKARKVQHPPTPRRFPPWERSRRALRGLSARLRPRAGQEQREAWARAGGAKRTRWQTGTQMWQARFWTDTEPGTHFEGFDPSVCGWIDAVAMPSARDRDHEACARLPRRCTQVAKWDVDSARGRPARSFRLRNLVDACPGYVARVRALTASGSQ